MGIERNKENVHFRTLESGGQCLNKTNINKKKRK